jgi:hypothetical protein
MLGGTAAMVEWAHDNKSIFYTQILSRLMPAPQKDDEPSGGTYNQFNISNISDRDAAMRIAFVLNSAVHGNPALAVNPELDIPAERVPVTPQEYINPPRWRAPADAPDMPEPMTPQEAEWAASLPLSPAERADQKLIRQTREASIENYHGSSAEQGCGAARSRPAERDPRSGQRDRMLARRRELL